MAETSKHPHFGWAKRRFRILVKACKESAPLLEEWNRALAKDESGLQCVNLVQDLVERMTPMRV